MNSPRDPKVPKDIGPDGDDRKLAGMVPQWCPVGAGVVRVNIPEAERLWGQDLSHRASQARLRAGADPGGMGHWDDE